MADKQYISEVLLLLDEELQQEMDKVIKDLILRFSDSITHRLIAGRMLKEESGELISALSKITTEISERYLLKNLQQIDELLKINPMEFNKYTEIGKSVGLAYCIRFHLQNRKKYEEMARDKALKGDWRFFQHCTSFYTEKAERRSGPGRKSSKAPELDIPSFESSGQK